VSDRRAHRGVAIALALAAACGPSVSTPADGGAGADAALADGPAPDADPDRAAVRGRVWAPNLAPGIAAAGEEMPVAGATVYLTARRPPPIPDHVYCTRCADVPAGADLSAPDGGFALAGIAPGTYWLVIEKGQFRRELQVELVAGRALEVAAADAMLPSEHAPERGLWIPRIAVAVGQYDRIEDVLGKLGLGTLDASARLLDPDGTFDAYFNQGVARIPTVGHVLDLLSDVDVLRRYHVVFLPCSYNIVGLDDPDLLRAIRQYVHDGGKVYATDWSGQVIDFAFPPQLELGDPYADTVGVYDPVSLTGSIGTAGSSMGATYDAEDAEAVDDQLAAWLGAQGIEAADFAITLNRNWLAALHRVQRGTSGGFPVYDQPRTWVAGSDPARAGKQPLSVTFEPTGCGRVLYSTFHTSPVSSFALSPQERILVYLLLEVAECSALPPVD
jgi:hypothetical protein